MIVSTEDQGFLSTHSANPVPVLKATCMYHQKAPTASIPCSGRSYRSAITTIKPMTEPRLHDPIDAKTADIGSGNTESLYGSSSFGMSFLDIDTSIQIHTDSVASGAGCQNESDDKDEEGDNAPLATISEVFSFAETFKTKLFLALGLFWAMVTGLTLPASLLILSKVMADVSAISQEGLDPVLEIVYARMVLGVVCFISETLQSGFLVTAADDMTINLKRKWFEAVVRQDVAYFDLQDVSGTSTIISTNGAKYKRGVATKLGAGVQFFFTVLGGFVLAFYSSWKASLAVMACVPVMATATGWILKINQTKSARDNAAYAEAGSVVYQLVANIRTILALNAGEEMIEKFEAATTKAYDGGISQLVLMGIANGALTSSFMLAYFVVIGLGSFSLYENVKSSGCDPSGAITDAVACKPSGENIFLALMGIVFGGATIPQISAALEAIQESRAACFPALLVMSRVSPTGDDMVDKEAKEHNQALQRRSSMTALPQYKIDVSSHLREKPSEVVGKIEFKEVSFAYPTRPEIEVFTGFNLTIEAGTTVALVGPSGSGKSTAVGLIERYYDPLSGSVSLDGVDLRLLNVAWLRQHIGLVSQEPALFATTIKENIKIAKPDATDSEVEAAARAANAHDFISSLEKGYETHVGDKGAQLSGGQKQRIAIARTLITKPKVILLDEATSALDSESEAIVQEALDLIMSQGNVTVVVIAHRLSTIKNADMIAVVKGGKVVETGNHNELLAKNGHYFDLVEAQKGKHVTSSTSSSSLATSKDSDSNPPSRSNSTTDLQDLDDTETNENVSTDAVIDIRNAHFTYPSRPDSKIFKGLGVDVREGETLAIVGPSGQGKSTIIQMIEEFYRPSTGKVSYNGDDVADLNVRWYRNELGLVSQEPTLFDGTIAQNIKFGMREATQAQIEEAARKANAHNFIMEFPDGYNTSVGSASSSQISGGQKQRIAIARALLRKPKVLLLDEATSALDTESEKVVQEALDEIMADSKLITIVIAHRLSTIRGASRIAYVDHGKVREIGTYAELMAKPNGLYKRLETLQSMDSGLDRKSMLDRAMYEAADATDGDKATEEKQEKEEEVDDETAKTNQQKAKELARSEYKLYLVGIIGAVLFGIQFPGQGFVFAYMIEVFYAFTLPCDDDEFIPDGFATCQAYFDFKADEMQELSFKALYLLFALIISSMIGSIIMFKAFGTATERINKRVRDMTFTALVRQEVAWYDVRSVGQITSQLSDDAAMIHSFSGEPIRTITISLASVGCGLVVSFYFMWEFAFIALGILPFMAFGEYMHNRQMLGADEGDITKTALESNEGAVAIETLVNIRVVASLSIENDRVEKYVTALAKKDNPGFVRNMIKGTGQGLGSLFQMWGYALMFYLGPWLLLNRDYEMRDYLISLFALMLSLPGLAAAMTGLTDAEKAKAAANRIFELTERVSAIDPLSSAGKIQKS